MHVVEIKPNTFTLHFISIRRLNFKEIGEEFKTCNECAAKTLTLVVALVSGNTFKYKSYTAKHSKQVKQQHVGRHVQGYTVYMTIPTTSNAFH